MIHLFLLGLQQQYSPTSYVMPQPQQTLTSVRNRISPVHVAQAHAKPITACSCCKREAYAAACSRGRGNAFAPPSAVTVHQDHHCESSRRNCRRRNRQRAMRRGSLAFGSGCSCGCGGAAGAAAAQAAAADPAGEFWKGRLGRREGGNLSLAQDQPYCRMHPRTHIRVSNARP